MGKISGMQRYAEQFAQAKVEATQRLISQYMADVMQEHMDRVMAQIISGKQDLKPFPERYHELRKVTYGR